MTCMPPHPPATLQEDGAPVSMSVGQGTPGKGVEGSTDGPSLGKLWADGWSPLARLSPPVLVWSRTPTLAAAPVAGSLLLGTGRSWGLGCRCFFLGPHVPFPLSLRAAAAICPSGQGCCREAAGVCHRQVSSDSRRDVGASCLL